MYLYNPIYILLFTFSDLCDYFFSHLCEIAGEDGTEIHFCQFCSSSQWWIIHDNRYGSFSRMPGTVECYEIFVMSCSYKYFSSFLERQWETIILVNSAGEITKTMDIKFSLWCYNVSRWPTLQWTAHCTNCARECIEMPVDKRKCLEMLPGTCKVSRRLNDIWQMIWDLYTCFYSGKSSHRKAMSHYFFLLSSVSELPI